MQREINSIPERRAILIEHQKYIEDKIRIYQMFAQLVDKKITFYDEALNSKNYNAKCVDYAEEWKHFKEFLGGIKYD